MSEQRDHFEVDTDHPNISIAGVMPGGSEMHTWHTAYPDPYKLLGAEELYRRAGLKFEPEAEGETRTA